LDVKPGLCLRCRGSSMLCGRSYCPLIARASAQRLLSPLGRLVEGSSPPSVFVGRHGYPRVRLAALVPPVRGDTRIYDHPEAWAGLGISEVLAMRLSLVRAYALVDARRPRGRLVEELRELALSSSPVDVEARLARRPRGVGLDGRAPPMGPSSPLLGLGVSGSPRVEKPVERVYGDVDLGAGDAVYELYRAGVPVSRISRILSVGALGRGRSRRLVPTRWAITAVDDAVSRRLLGRVRDLPELGEPLAYIHRAPGNVFAAILLPGRWSYEWVEAWFPHTLWNPSDELEVEGDWEGYRGRSSYASLGGCYYAARLAAAEALLRMGRQARVVLLREVYEGFYDPIGVWFVREHVRLLLRGSPYRAVDAGDALRYVASHTRLSAGDWLRASRLLRDEFLQARITGWIGVG